MAGGTQPCAHTPRTTYSYFFNLKCCAYRLFDIMLSSNRHQPLSKDLHLHIRLRSVVFANVKRSAFAVWACRTLRALCRAHVRVDGCPHDFYSLSFLFPHHSYLMWNDKDEHAICCITSVPSLVHTFRRFIATLASTGVAARQQRRATTRSTIPQTIQFILNIFFFPLLPVNIVTTNPFASLAWPLTFICELLHTQPVRLDP